MEKLILTHLQYVLYNGYEGLLFKFPEISRWMIDWESQNGRARIMLENIIPFARGAEIED